VGNELIKTLMENPLSQYILGHKKIIYFALLKEEGIERVHLSFSKGKGRPYIFYFFLFYL
jgi:hypothetical protein